MSRVPLNSDQLTCNEGGDMVDFKPHGAMRDEGAVLPKVSCVVHGQPCVKLPVTANVRNDGQSEWWC